MKISSSSLRGTSFALAAIFLLLTCCTKVDDNLGTTLIPSGQQMSVGFADLATGISTYNTIADSVVTSSMDWIYTGSLDEKKFGRTNVTAVTQFFPDYRSDTVDNSAIHDRQIDSLWLVSNLKYVAGDTLVENEFDIYRLIESINHDSTYYANFPYKQYIDSKPMFSFTLSGNSTGSDYDTMRLKVNDKTLADAFMDELLNTDSLTFADSTLFLEKFKGLCITPKPTATTNNTLYRMGLGFDSNDSYFTLLVLYGHEYLTGQPDSVKSVIVRSYVISNDSDYTIGASVSCFEHDYTGTTIEGNYVDESADNWGAVQKTTYIQGFLGVNTSIEFNDDFMKALKALVPEGKHIFINQAKMTIALDDATVENLDAAPTQLGTYFNYATVNSIPDYYYASSSSLNYDGKLNRTSGRYTMDIAVYLQKLLDGDYTAPYRLTLGMSAYDYLTEGRVALQGTGSTTPVNIAVTYTVIGK